MIPNEQADRMLFEMVDTPSASGSEAAMATLSVEWMNDLGLNAKVDGIGNAVGEIGPVDGPTVVLLGHIDTVPKILPVFVSGFELYGRGSVDAKGSFATFIAAVASMSEHKVRYVVIGAVDEETAGSKGARYVVDKYQPDIVVIGEPSGSDGVTIGYKGLLAATYKVSCAAAHSAADVDNASQLAIDFWNRLTSIADRYGSSEKTGMFWSPQCHVSEFSGTAEDATLRFSLRIPPDFNTDGFLRAISENLGDAVMDIEEETTAVIHPRTSPITRAISRAQRHHGLTPRPKLKTGTCDMNVVASHWDVPTVAYGPGDSSLDHTDEERIDLSEYHIAISVLSTALSSLQDELLSTTHSSCEKTS